MGLARTLAVALIGMEGQLVEVECDISTGLPGLSFTGLRDTLGDGVARPDPGRPAELRRRVAEPQDHRRTAAGRPAQGRLPLRSRGRHCSAGRGRPGSRGAGRGRGLDRRTGLDGRLRPVRGVLPSVLAARGRGVRHVVVAAANAAEAALVPASTCARRGPREIARVADGDGPALAARAARTACDRRAGARISPTSPDRSLPSGPSRSRRPAVTTCTCWGHRAQARRCWPSDCLACCPLLTIGLARGHRRALGRRPARRAARLIRRPPLQAPHHTASMAALVGGGSHLARPGAISLAHHGVLFLDEAPLFRRRRWTRCASRWSPGRRAARAAEGRCATPPGSSSSSPPTRARAGPAARCTCAPQARRRHHQRLSGPLMDRLDLRVPGRTGRSRPTCSTSPRSARPRRGRRTRVRRAGRSGRAMARHALAAQRGVPGSTLRKARWRCRRRGLRPAQDTWSEAAQRAWFRSGASPRVDVRRPRRPRDARCGGRRRSAVLPGRRHRGVRGMTGSEGGVPCPTTSCSRGLPEPGGRPADLSSGVARVRRPRRRRRPYPPR